MFELSIQNKSVEDCATGSQNPERNQWKLRYRFWLILGNHGLLVPCRLGNDCTYLGNQGKRLASPDRLIDLLQEEASSRR